MPETTNPSAASKPAAKKTAARKPAAKKSATKKSATRKAAARRPAAKKAPAKRASVKTVAARTTDVSGAFKPRSNVKVDQKAATARIESSVSDAVKFVRDVAHTSIGVGVVVQDRITRRSSTDTAQYSNFLEEAKEKGHALVVDVRDRFEPVAQRVADRFEPLERRLPNQIKEALESGRERVRSLVAA